MLYTLHPQLTGPRWRVAFDQARAFTAPEEPGHQFASILETYATLQARLDEFAGTLPDEEQEAFTLCLLGEDNAASLLRHLLTASCQPHDNTPLLPPRDRTTP